MYIYLSEAIYYNTSTEKIYDGENELIFSKKRFPFLKLLIERKGGYVTKDNIISVSYPGEVADYYIAKNVTSLKYQLTKDLIKCGLPGDIIKESNGQYKIEIYSIVDENTVSKKTNAELKDKVCTYFLTPNTISNATTETILGREKELEDVLSYFRRQKHNRSFHIYGFGGVGKTSFVRLLMTYLQDEVTYDYVAVINYHVGLINSMVEAIELEDYKDDSMTENDAEKKWKTISKLLRNSNKRKLFVIDNVDIDNTIGQNPLSEEELIAFSDLTGWRNTDVIITSRIPDICGAFYSYELCNLGDENDYDRCIKVFTYYNKKIKLTEENIDIVKKMIKLANYNTMVIELLAKISINEGSLENLYNKLIDIGFSYSNVTVSTMHHRCRETIKSQLMRLFEINKRTELEKMILWDFHALPEGIRVSHDELVLWLGYNVEELDALMNEGWLGYMDYYFFLHPLIRQSIQTDEAMWNQYWNMRTSIFRSRRKSLVELVESKAFFDDTDSFEVGLRKLIFFDSITYHGLYQLAGIKLYVADIARRRGARTLGIIYYKSAYDELKEKCKRQLEINKEQLWKATYYYGYMLSYTKSGMWEAERLLRESLDITESFIVDKDFNDEHLMLIAASMDHLGYVLSNQDTKSLKLVAEADFYLRFAVLIRKVLCEVYSDNVRMIHDYAWSLDNLGSLYAYLNIDEIIEVKNEEYLTVDDIVLEMEQSRRYLKEALYLRILLSKLRQMPDSTEVAWTYCNLASLLSKDDKGKNEAEESLKKALEIYHRLDQKYPGQHVGSEARTCSAYARLLKSMPDRKNEAMIYYKKAIELNEVLEKDYPGTYAIELEKLKKEFASL